MSLLTYLSGYEGTINDKTMSWLRTWSPWMPNGTMEDLWMAFLQGYQGSLNDRMLAWARATSGLSGGSLNDALLGLPDGGAQYGGASLGLYFNEDKYESGAVGAKPTSKPFSNIITFTRASGGGRFNSSGVYEYVGNDVPRLDYGPVTLAPRGLLIEEQRTNLLTYSGQFDNADWTKQRATITANAIVAPDGTVAADKLVEDTTADATHRVLRASVFTGTVFSVYAKAGERTKVRLTIENLTDGNNYGSSSTFDLVLGTNNGTGTMVAVGGGWYRCTVIATSPVNAAPFIYLADAIGNSTYTGDGTSGLYIWGAQLEAGAFPTSYIPTVASQVTRSADVASVNTLSPWYNATEGTLFVEFATPNQLVTFADAAVLDDGTANNRVRLGINSASPNKLVTGSYSSGVSVAVDTGIPYTPGLQKLAASYAKDNFANAANGALYTVVSAGNVPAGLNTLRVGKHTTLGYINGHIQRIEYYPRRLTDALLQSLTTP